MFRYVATILVAILLSVPLVAGITPFPASFHTQMVPTNGTSLYVRVGGKGPAVVLLHGFGFTGDMWAPLAIVLAKDHTVIVPDLRGMGMSDHPDTGYTKKNQAVDIAGVLDELKVQKADLVTHDIGNMVGYALAVQYPVRVTRWVVIDAPLPGIGDWHNIVRSPMLWHFDFRGPDEERLVQGRERIYLDRFWNELSGDPKRIDEDTRQHFAALYARPHAMHDAFEQFGTLRQDAADNKALLAKGGKITMPVFALGAEKFFGKNMADHMQFAASNVTGGIVPNSGHWIMEENPQSTIKLVTDFLTSRSEQSKGLDEVGDIPPALQPKLLRVLQEQEFERLGSGRTHKVNVRLVAATNRNLGKMLARGHFRCDLYYRLNVFPILLPSLRERREDIPALVTHFVRLFSRRMGKQVDSIPPETMAAFQWYSWPGNIRELQNLVERAVILSRDDVLPNPLHKNQTEVMIPTLHRSRTQCKVLH